MNPSADGSSRAQVPDHVRLWELCTDALRPRLREAVWISTFSDVTPVAVAPDRFVVEVASTITKERIESRYADDVRAALVDIGLEEHAFVIEVNPDLEALPRLDDESGLVPTADEVDTAALPDDLADALDRARPGTSSASGSAGADTPVTGINPHYSFEAFVTGPSNRFAHAAALAVAEEPGRRYNPLFIHGGAGLGKTHLLQAIVNYIRSTYPNFTCRYVSTEVFLNEFVESIRTNSGAAFKRRYRDIDVLLVDDIQFMENKEGLQDEFFHTFNSLHGAGQQIVLSSDRPPRNIATLEDRLRSRFEWGLITDIQPPDLETRIAILRKKTLSEAMDVPPEILEFIATHISDNIRELEGALIRVCAYASLTGEPLTLELASEVLADIVGEQGQKPLTANDIVVETAEYFGFSVEDLLGRRRQRELVTARQVAMWLCRQLTELSYPSIAKVFGGRDHTTIMHAVDRVNDMMSEKREVYDQVTALMLMLKERRRP